MRGASRPRSVHAEVPAKRIGQMIGEWLGFGREGACKYHKSSKGALVPVRKGRGAWGES